MPLVSFSSGQVISSANVNANFGLCVLTDTSRTITVTHTYSASQTFSAGWTSAAGVTVSAGGLTVTGNSTITGTLTSLTGLTSSGTASLAVVTASSTLNVTGIATFSAQVIVNSTLSVASDRLNVDTTGRVLIGTAVTSGTAAGELTLTNGHALRGLNAAGNNSYGLIAMNGSDKCLVDVAALGAVFGASVSIPGTLTLTAAASKLVPGATSFSHRNNADSADNLLITDAGTVTLRGKMVLPGITPALDITAGGTINIGAVGVVGARATGYTNSWTGTPNRATAYDPSTVTLVQLAQRVKAIQDDLTVHGLIGV